MARNTLPALSSDRPFIAPRMSLGMKLAIGFLSVLGVVIVAGVGLTLTEIMQRLDGPAQAQVAGTVEEQAPAISEVATSTLRAYPVLDDADGSAALALPRGGVVQQLMPYQGNVYLLVDVPKRGQRILILDANSGKIKQDIRLQNSEN